MTIPAVPAPATVPEPVRALADGLAAAFADSQPLSEFVAGLDVHKDTVVIAVRPLGASRRWYTETVEQRPCVWRDLAAFFVAANVRSVVMEATGPYWYGVYDALAAAGLDVMLINPQQLRALRGRKRDLTDAQRLASALAADVLEPSFVATGVQRQLRKLTRRHVQILEARTRAKNQVIRTLREESCILDRAVSDIFGVTGMTVLRGLASGEPAIVPEALLQMVQRPDLVLEAAAQQLDPFSRLALSQQLAEIGLCNQQLAEVRTAIESVVTANEEVRSATERIRTIPGCGLLVAACLLAETGTDLTRQFGCAERLCSWVGVVPGQHESAGRNTSKRTPAGNCYARRILMEWVMAFKATGNTKPGKQLRQWYSRVRRRRGPQRANVALSRKLLSIVYALLTKGEDFRELTAAA